MHRNGPNALQWTGEHNYHENVGSEYSYKIYVAFPRRIIKTANNVYTHLSIKLKKCFLNVTCVCAGISRNLSAQRHAEKQASGNKTSCNCCRFPAASRLNDHQAVIRRRILLNKQPSKQGAIIAVYEIKAHLKIIL